MLSYDSVHESEILASCLLTVCLFDTIERPAESWRQRPSVGYTGVGQTKPTVNLPQKKERKKKTTHTLEKNELGRVINVMNVTKKETVISNKKKCIMPVQ